MDLKQLQRFVTVADRQSFISAAKVLYLSQPALTRSIQLLEAAIDADLFERGPRGVVLTRAGVELLPHAKAILNERDRAMSAISTVKRDITHRVTVGTLPRLSSQVLGAPMIAFCDNHPEVEVRIVENSLPVLLAGMREAHIDFCFGPRETAADYTEVAFQPLLVQEIVIVARTSHLLHGRGTLTLADLCDQRWIVLDSEDTRTNWRAMFVRRELPVPKTVIWLQSWDMMQRTLLNSDCVMVTGSIVVASYVAAGLVTQLRTEPDVFLAHAGLYVPLHRTSSRLAQNFMVLVREHCQTAELIPAGASPFLEGERKS